jgi:hypothetical protein
MTRFAFTNLCNSLATVLGENVFRSENGFLSTRNADSLASRGGLIPGEIKTAISIRILAGGSYLDLMPLFCVSVSSIYGIFDQFLDWVMQALQFPLAKILQTDDWTALQSIADPFSYSSNGILSGTIGALDGIAIRIRSPTLAEVPDPGNYYCRKGFFALNVQAICTHSKKFLWCYTSNKGSTHDSVAFTNSRLYSLLLAKNGLLQQKGLYLVGDSAYNLTPFLLVPYTTDEIRNGTTGVYDSFNFYLSSSRIQIECAFGELVRRWGILWRTLQFDLRKCQRIIQVCMLLHNHILDDQANSNGSRDNSDFRHTLPMTTLNDRAEQPFPLVTDNDAQLPRGRRTTSNEYLRMQGESIRRAIAVNLSVHEMTRPMHSTMRYNEFGHIYFDG